MDGFSHLILSGSTCSVLDDHPFHPPVASLIRDAVAKGIPVLGICYGHQLIARVVLGDDHVRRTKTPEMGWLEIHAEPKHAALFEGLPNPFRAFVGHFDEVCDLPEDWQITARSEHCAVQGYVNEKQRLLGFQFHPEFDLETGNVCFATDREALARHGFDADRIVREAVDDGSGRVLFRRFLDYW
jgi:GMP synthase (glutamine-hydrolysing)